MDADDLIISVYDHKDALEAIEDILSITPNYVDSHPAEVVMMRIIGKAQIAKTALQEAYHDD